MFKELIALFQKPPAKTLAQDELEESQRQYLTHGSAAAYHGKLAEFYKGNIERLEMYVKKS